MRTHEASPSRRSWLQAAVGLSALGALGGCVVAPRAPYYRPGVSGGAARERRAWCQGQAGPVTGLELDLPGGVQLRARTLEAPPAGRPPGIALRAELTIPPGTAFRFQGPPVLMADSRAIDGFMAVSGQRTYDWPAGEWVHPDRLRPGAGPAFATDEAEPFGRAVLRVGPVPGADAPHILVRGLSVVRDGGREDIPPAQLARPASRAQPDTYRTAEEQAALRARFEACERETPQRACRNLLDHGEASHAHESATLGWRARWYRVSRPSGAVLEGEGTLRPRMAGRWRLDDSRLEVRDDSGRTQPLRVAALQLSFSDRLALHAPLAAVDVPTRVVLDATIPAGVPHFELRLAPYLHNLGRGDVPPVRFERRVLEVGVEPFNC